MFRKSLTIALVAAAFAALPAIASAQTPATQAASAIPSPANVQAYDVDGNIPAKIGLNPGESLRLLRKDNFVGTTVTISKSTILGGTGAVLRTVPHPATLPGYRSIGYFTAANAGKVKITITHRVPGPSGATTTQDIEVTVYATGPNKGPVVRPTP